MHLLRLLPGGMPGRRDRRGAKFRVRHRDSRGAVLRQGQTARQRRPLGGRDREGAVTGSALPMSGVFRYRKAWIPTKARTHFSAVSGAAGWVPAFAGTYVANKLFPSLTLERVRA